MCQNYTTGHQVAQVRAVIRPSIPHLVTRLQDIPTLLYVEFFRPSKTGVRQLHQKRNSGHLMYKIERDYSADGTQTGAFVPLTAIWRPVQLIPFFGVECPEGWNSENSMGLADSFLLNPYDTRHTFETFQEQ